MKFINKKLFKNLYKMSAANIKKNSENLRKLILPTSDESYVKFRQSLYQKVELAFDLDEKNRRERS